WAALNGVEAHGYEIHVGSTRGQVLQPLLDLDNGPDGCVSADGFLAGTYLHGIFEQAKPRQALLDALARARGFSRSPTARAPGDPYDELAGVLSANLDLSTDRFASLAAVVGRSRRVARNLGKRGRHGQASATCASVDVTTGRLSSS